MGFRGKPRRVARNVGGRRVRGHLARRLSKTQEKKGLGDDEKKGERKQERVGGGGGLGGGGGGGGGWVGTSVLGRQCSTGSKGKIGLLPTAGGRRRDRRERQEVKHYQKREPPIASTVGMSYRVKGETRRLPEERGKKLPRTAGAKKGPGTP